MSRPSTTQSGSESHHIGPGPLGRSTHVDDSPAPGQRLRWEIVLGGTVQAVGFRPFVHSLATELDLAGSVANAIDGVRLTTIGRGADLEEFLRRLVDESPPLARLDTLDVTEAGPARPDDPTMFEISDAGVERQERRITGMSIPADTATCPTCLAELDDVTDRRHGHPFISCLDCGPRYTVIRELPYARATTTMAAFDRCPECAAEFSDPSDRRHHAEPICCPACGPRLWIEPAADPDSDPLERAAEQLARGDIVAVKGDGGYHLVCDATNEDAVAVLRQRKERPHRPLAILVADVDAAEVIGRVTADDAALLTGADRPIVLVPRRADSPLAAGVAPGGRLVGLMLPSSAIQHLLLGRFAAARARLRPDPAMPALVVTSGNLAGEPICHTVEGARDRLGSIADAIVHHDREILLPCDDSVIRRISGAATPIRRSRGQVPTSIALPATCPPLLALGNDLKNVIGLAAGRRIWLSQHIGDHGDLATSEALAATVAHLERLSGVTPEHLVTDRHPDAHTRRWARAHAGGRPVVEVGHHHAHLAALMAEHGLTPDSVVLGIVADGTGFGDDGTMWGGEVLLGTYGEMTRVGHLAEVAMPGGDADVTSPARMALIHARAAGLPWAHDLAPLESLPTLERDLLDRQLTAIECGVAPPTSRSSSLGRLFDAAASLLGVCHRATYEGQAAIELEARAADVPRHDVTRVGRLLDHLDRDARVDVCTGVGGLDARTAGSPARQAAATPLRTTSASSHQNRRPGEGSDNSESAPSVIDPSPIVRRLVAGRRHGIETTSLAAWFHSALADTIATAALGSLAEADRVGLEVAAVGLSGGVFQNDLLTSLLSERLRRGIRTSTNGRADRGDRAPVVLTHRRVPPNDGGLALGQAMVAAQRMNPSEREDRSKPRRAD